VALNQVASSYISQRTLDMSDSQLQPLASVCGHQLQTLHWDGGREGKRAGKEGELLKKRLQPNDAYKGQYSLPNVESIIGF